MLCASPRNFRKVNASQGESEFLKSETLLCTAVVYPSRLSAITVALSAMEAGAALRANAISESAGIR